MGLNELRATERRDERNVTSMAESMPGRLSEDFAENKKTDIPNLPFIEKNFDQIVFSERKTVR